MDDDVREALAAIDLDKLMLLQTKLSTTDSLILQALAVTCREEVRRRAGGSAPSPFKLPNGVSQAEILLTAHTALDSAEWFDDVPVSLLFLSLGKLLAQAANVEPHDHTVNALLN